MLKRLKNRLSFSKDIKKFFGTIDTTALTSRHFPKYSQFSKASREFNNATKLLEKRQKDEQVRFCEDFTVDFLLGACKNNLEEINKRG